MTGRGSVTFGDEVARLHTPPLRPLTPETSAGFAFVEWCEARGVALLPWQRWLAVHALELKPSGGYRFRTVLVLVGRQCGKTTFAKLLAVWVMAERGAQLVLGAAQSLDIAREAWQGAVQVATNDETLARRVTQVRFANGEQCLTLEGGARYRITAATRSAGRGLSVDLLLLDELREQTDWTAWSALSKTTLARPDGLIFAITNAGDAQSVVLNQLREGALAGRDDSLGLFEWSAPDGAALDDPAAWAAGCPGLGFTVSEDGVRAALATDPPAVFRTEILCQRVDATDAAVEADAWKSCADPAGVVDRESRLVACFDASPVSGHCTLVVAAREADGRVRVEVAGDWRSTGEARAALPDLLGRIGAEVLGWFPTGPAGALAPLLGAVEGAEEIKGVRVSQACQHLADLVQARRLLHPSDPLLDAQVAGSHRLQQGDGWRFSRYGQASCDAAYACAGAALLAESLAPVERKYSGPLVV